MRLKAIALDYDGTMAQEGVLGPEVRAAIKRARASGLTVLLVTGRILGDLRRITGDLSFVDAVVAENGAVVAFPRSGRSAAMHIPPSSSPQMKSDALASRYALRTGCQPGQVSRGVGVPKVGQC